jgi:hypothetical protein
MKTVIEINLARMDSRDAVVNTRLDDHERRLDNHERRVTKLER